MQLMHVYVQKSTSTTCPRSEPSESGFSPGVLNQRWGSVKGGAAPRFCSVCASATRLARLAFAAAVCRVEEEPPHGEEPFAGLNFASRPVIWCRRPVTVEEHSRAAVRFTSGMFC